MSFDWAVMGCGEGGELSSCISNYDVCVLIAVALLLFVFCGLLFLRS